MATWKKVVTESSSGQITQNAATATALATGGTITFTGDVTGGTTPTYTGGGNLSIGMTISANSVDGTMLALGSDASGDLMYYNGTNWVRLAKGTDGESLHLASGIPSWSADHKVTEPNLRSTLATVTENVTIGDGTDVTVTTSGDLTVTGDLLVQGDRTTVSTTILSVEDKLIKLADVASPTTTTADGAGIQVESSATEAEWPEVKWAKDSGLASNNRLTGWSISNYVSTSSTDHPIAIMDFKTSAGAPSGNSAGVGSFTYNTNDDTLYLRTA